MEVKYPLKVSTVQFKCPKCGNFMVGEREPFHTGKYRHSCPSCEHLEFLDKVYPYIHYDMAPLPETPGGTFTVTLSQNP